MAAATVVVLSGSPTDGQSPAIGASGRTFLGQVAAIAYDGAEPDRARAWAESTAGRDAETEFGGVRFRLEASDPRLVTLTLLAPAAPDSVGFGPVGPTAFP